MDLHRLRIVGFDTSVSEKEGEKNFNAELEKYDQEDWKTSTERNNNDIGDVDQCLDDNKSPPRRLSKKCLGDKRRLPEKSSRPSRTSVKKYLNDKITTPGTSKMCRPRTSEKILDDISFPSPPETLKKHSFIRRKSKSEIFKITPQKKSTKRDLKFNSSDTSLTKEFRGSTNSLQRKRTLARNLRKRSSRVRHKVEHVKEKNDVQFLFTRETPCFMRFCRKRAENERTKTKKERVSRFPNDIYGFQKSNRSMDQHLYQMSCFKFIDIDKIPFKKMKMGYRRKPKPPQTIVKCNCRHHAMRVLKSDCGYDPSICYNLNTRPHPRRFQNRNYEEKKKSCLAKDETVEVSPSSFSPKPCFYDACTSPNNVEVSRSFHTQPPDVSEEPQTPLPQTATVTSEDSQKSTRPSCKGCMSYQNAARFGPTVNMSKNDRIKNKKKVNVFSSVCNRFFSRFVKRIVDFHSRKNLLGKSYIKHICIGLLIVLWSPCLLAGVLVWVVMFPVKFINISKGKSKNNPYSEYQRMSFGNYLPQKRSFISTMASWCTRTVGIVVNSFNVVMSMFKLKSKAPAGVGGSCFSPAYPNPRKRYSLIYVCNRGWVMKPLRRRKIRSVTSSRVVQSMRCEFRPKIRSLRQQKSSKKVYIECPVHKGKIYPRRRASLARLAYKLLSTAKRPRCTCLNAHGSKPLHYHHHGRQQVNIPATFSNSADERIYINLKKNNSKVIADDIAQEDLAKNRLGQRKNGTLPFRFDLKYPCGTKHLLITNSKISRDHTIGLAGKTLNMSTKFTPSLVIKGSNGQLPKCWTRHESSNAVNKANDKIKNFKDITTNSMPTKHIHNSKLNGLRNQIINCVITSNYPYGKSHKSSLTNKKLCSLQNNLSLRNKCVLAALSKSALNKQANTSANKINNAHKIQNTSKHIPSQKVTNKSNKTENAYLDRASKYTFGAIHYLPKHACKCKNCIPTQKHPSPVKIKSRIKSDIALNSSFGKIYNHSKQSNKYKPHHIPETLKQSNTADITNTNRNKGLHCHCRHHQYKQGEKNKYKPRQIPATLKQSNTADITNTNRNKGLHCPCQHQQYKQCEKNKYKLHQILATLKQSNTSDIMTKSNRNIASHRPCRHKQYKQSYRYEPRQISIETLMKPNVTMTSRDIALNCPSGEKHEQYNHAFKYKGRQIPVATQMQPNIADKMTMTSQDIALNCPSSEKHEQYNHAFKYKARQIPVATQMQPNTADNMTMTSRSIALNCPSGEKHEQYNHAFKYKARQIPVATQMQPNIADNMTMTSRAIALNCPSDEKHEHSNHAFKYKARQIPVATQMQPNIADNMTMTSRDLTLKCPSGEKHEQYNHAFKSIARQIPVAAQMQPNIADNVTMTNRDIALNCPSDEKHEQYNHAFKYKAYQIPVATQMQPNIADNMTMTSRIIALNCPSGEKHEQYNHAFKSIPRKIPVAAQMQPNIADNVTMTSRDIALKCLHGIKSSTANKDIHFIPSKAHQDTPCTSLSKFGTQKQSYTADTTTMTNRDIGSNYLGVVNKEILCISKISAKDTIYTQNTSLSKSTYKYLTGHRSVTTQKQSNTIDVTTMTNRNVVLNNFFGDKYIQSTPSYKYKTNTNYDMASNYFGSVLPSTANKEILCIPKQDISIQKEDFKIDKSVYCANDYKRSKTNKIVPPEQNIQSKADKETATAHNTQPKLIQVTPHTSLHIVSDFAGGTNQVGTESQAGYPQKLSIPKPDVSEQSRKNMSQTTPLTDTGLESPVAPLPRKTLIVIETPSTFPTNIQELPCDCTCERNTVPPLNYKFPQHLPSVQSKKISSKLTQLPSHISQEQSKSFGIAADYARGTSKVGTEAQAKYQQTHNNSSQETPLADMQGLTSDPVAAQSHQTRKVSKTSSTFPTNIQELPYDCTCECNSIPPTFHRSSQPKQSLQRVTLETDRTKVQPDIPKVNKNWSKSLQSPEHLPSTISQPTSPLFGIVTDCRCRETPQQTKQIKKMEQIETVSKNTYIHKSSSAKEPRSQQPTLTKVPPQSFGIAIDCTCRTNQVGTESQANPQKFSIPKPHVSDQSRKNISQTTPLTGTQGLKSPVAPLPRKTLIVTETPSTFPTNIQELPCDCTCECNTVPSLNSKFPQHLPIAEPNIPKINSLHRSPQPKQSSQRTILGTRHGPSVQSKKKSTKLTQLPSQISQEQSKTFGIAADCACGTSKVGTEAQAKYQQTHSNSSQATPSADMQGHKSDPVAAQPHQIRIASKTSSTFPTNIQELPSECNTVPPLHSKFPQHLPIAEPNIPKINSLHRSPQPKQSSQRTTLGTHGPSVQSKKISSKLTQLPSHILQEQSKSFGIAADCACGTSKVGTEAQAKYQQTHSNSSQATPSADMQGHKSDPVAAQPHQIRIASKTSSTFPTNIQGLPCDCTCECNTVPPLNSKFPQHLPIAEPNIPKINSLHRSPQPKQSLQRTTLGTHRPSVQSKKISFKLMQLPSEISQEQSKSFGIAADCVCGTSKVGTEAQAKYQQTHNNSSQATPLADMQGLKSDPVAAQSHQTRKVSKTSSTFPTNIQELPCDCTCECNSIPPTFHRSSQPKQSLQRDTLETDRTKVQPDIPKVSKNWSKSLQSPEHLPSTISQPTSPAKEPRSQHPKLIKVPPQSFGIAIDCTCGKNQPTVAEKNLYNDVKSHIAKETQGKPASKKISTSKFPKLPEYLTPPKSQHSKCRCPVRNLQHLVGEQSYDTTERKTRSKIPKSLKCLSCLKNLNHKCSCPDKSIQDPLGEQPYGIRERTTSSKRNTVNMLLKCPFPVENLQEPIRQRSRNSIFSRNFLDIPLQFQCSSSHKGLDGRSFESDIPVAQSTTRRAHIRSCERPEDTCSVDKTSSQLQLPCSRLSQYSNSVYSLVMNVRSTLFSRKLSKQGKIPKHLKSCQRSTLSPFLNKTCQTCHPPIDNTDKSSLYTRKSMLGDESNRLFRRSHSSHGMAIRCPCQVHQAHVCKPLLVDKSCSCLPSVSKSSHRPSFLSYSSKLEYRCQPDNDKSSSSLRLSKLYCYLFPRLSQRGVSQQSKTSEYSSIVISEHPNECKCSIDESSSTPKDGMSHQILKTLFLRKPQSKSQQLLSQRNRSQFSAHFNPSQETLSSKLALNKNQGSYKKHDGRQLSEKQSLVQYYRTIPEACRCAKDHLGKTTSRQMSQNLNRSQESTSAQKPSSKKFHPQYSLMPPTAEQTVPLQHFLHPEPLKSKHSFNFLQSKQLIEKIKSVTDIISTNSHKNKQEKRSSTLDVQTAPIIPGKCACWPEKLHQLSTKISQHSRKSVKKISPSQQPPNLLSSQPTLPYNNSLQSRVRTNAQAENPQHLSIQIQEKVEKPFVKIFQRTKADQAKPIIPGRCKCVRGQKVNTEHSSNNKLQPKTDLQKLSSSLQHLPDAQPDIPQKDSLHRTSSSKKKQLIMEKVDKQLDQRTEVDLIIPIIPGRCRCAREQKIKTEHFLSNIKLQTGTDLQKLPSIQSHSLLTDHQRFQSPTVSHPTPKTTFGTGKQTEFFQHQKQLVASKLSQPHPSQHAIHHNAPLHNSQPTRKKPDKCFKHRHEQQVIINSLHKIANSQSPGMLQHSSEKFQKLHLVTGACTDSEKKNRFRGEYNILIQRSEIPQSLKNPQIQTNQKIQTTLQDQKQLLLIPTNLDKQPPELLQRHSAGDRRKCTAEGGVQQHYPDFNRVSIHYPGHNGIGKQPVLTPGLNRNVTIIKPPTCAPCYTNSANRCALQSLHDEAALRRAYRRRPLRYTPPRQLPKIDEKIKLKEKSLKKNKKKRGAAIRDFFRCLLKSVKQAEDKTWPTDVTCHPMWLTTLKRRPCYWIYKTCPRVYPTVLSIGKCMNTIHRLFAYVLTLCFWSPLILCFYLCCNVLCRSS